MKITKKKKKLEKKITMDDYEKEEGFKTKSKELGFSSKKCLISNSSDYTVLDMQIKIVEFMNKAWEATEYGTKAEDKNYMGFALLFQSVPEVLILQTDTTKAFWDASKTRHAGAEKVRETRLQTLIAKFDKIEMKDADTVDVFVVRLSEYKSKAASLRETIEESKPVRKFLKSLPKKRYIQIVLDARFEDFGERLKTYEKRKGEAENEQQDKHGKLEYANTDTQQNHRENYGSSRGRGQEGLSSLRGRDRRRSGTYQYGSNKQGRDKKRDTSHCQCYRCDKIRYYASDCHYILLKFQEAIEKEDEETQEADKLNMHKVVYLNIQKVKPSSFGTGASINMRGKREFLLDLDKTITRKVRLRDDSRKGLVRLAFKDGKMKIWNNVYYIPKLKNNIVSLGKDTKAGCEVRAKDNLLMIYKHLGQLVVNTNRFRGRLYKVTLEVLMLKCSCLLYKQTRQYFPQATPYQAFQTAELIHRDLCRKKRDALDKLDKFKKFKILVGQETRATIKTFQSHRRGEFVSHTLQPYCDKHGIKRHLTAFCSPLRKGLVERRNRTIEEMTKSILIDMSVPSYLCGESEIYSTFLINRIATRSNVEVIRIVGYNGYARRDSEGKESSRDSGTFIIKGLREFGSSALKGVEDFQAAGESSQDTRVMSENMMNQEELDRDEEENDDDELVKSNDDGNEELEWSQSQLKRAKRVSVRPTYMNDSLLIDTERERFVMVINEESWIEACKEPSLYQKENLLVMVVDDLRAAEALKAEANRYHLVRKRKLKEVEKHKDERARRLTSFKPAGLIFLVKPCSPLSIIFCSFYMAARGESWIHGGEDMDWSLFTVYGENYSQAQDLYNKTYGPIIYDVYDGDDQIKYGGNDGQVQDILNEVGFHVVEDVQLEQTKDVYGEEVANTINRVFGDKAFDTSNLNDTCSDGLTKETICGECSLSNVPLKSRVTFSFLQRSQLLSYFIYGDMEFVKIDIRKMLSRDVQRSKESCGTEIKIYATSKIPIVGESDGGHRVDPVDGKSMAGNIFYVDESSMLQCLRKREYVEYDLIEVQRIPESEQKVLTKVFGRLKFKEMRGLVDIKDLSKMDFKLKRENVGLSLK